jgi:nucleotide-binding universal stress UspA family protein
MNAHPTILIAVDLDEGADRAALAATALFGTDATYRFAHVAQPVPLTPPVSSMFPASATVAPIGVAPVDTTPRDVNEPADDTLDSARAVAARAATDAGMSSAEAVGLVGHPADAILDEAVSCGADVIVVTAREHSWIDRLFHHSVADEIQKTSTIPVLVVPAPA